MRKHLLLLILAYCSISAAQNPGESGDFDQVLAYTSDKYGIDQQLVNGRFFEYKYIHALGHPFLLENKYYNADLLIKGTDYHNIETKYDIYEQDLIIRTTTVDFVVQTIVPMEMVSAFSIEGMQFRKLRLLEKEPAYYQVVAEEEHISCLYFWYKTRDESLHNVNFSSYKFRKSRHLNYILINGQAYQYKNNRSFTNSFPESLRRGIKSYLKSGKYKVRKVTDTQMKEIIGFCNSTLQNTRQEIQ